VILEEAAYCDEGLVNEVVVPLLSMSSSVLLCISTLLDGSNHYSKMIALKDARGESVFESIAITLVCDACLKTEHPEKCRHKVSEVPRWISSTKVEIVRTLLAEDPAMLLRESLGISADGSEKCFRSVDIEAFGAATPKPLMWDDRDHRNNVRFTFTAVDPSGGGASAFSIATVLVYDGKIQVLGTEALITREVRNTHKLFLDHLINIRKIPFLAHTVSVLCLESNLGFESQHLLHYLQESNFPRWVSMAEAARGELGWLTTGVTKEKMALALREALQQNSISYHKNFTSLSLGAEAAKLRIKDEIGNYSVVTEPPKQAFGKVRKTYTGKMGGMQDDVAIALQLAVCSTRVFFQSSKYVAFMSNNPTQYLAPAPYATGSTGAPGAGSSSSQRG